MRITIDAELEGLVSKEWIIQVLSIVEEEYLENLRIRIINPTNMWLEGSLQEIWDRCGIKAYLREKEKRTRLGRCTGSKQFEIYVTPRLWNRCRERLIEALFHETYHANDNGYQFIGDGNHTVQQYLQSPSEVKAREYTEEMLKKAKKLST